MSLILDERLVRKRALDFDGNYGPIGRFQLFVLKLRANAMLNRTIKVRSRRGEFSAAPIPAHLRQDIGLPPETSRFDHWRY